MNIKKNGIAGKNEMKPRNLEEWKYISGLKMVKMMSMTDFRFLKLQAFFSCAGYWRGNDG